MIEGKIYKISSVIGDCCYVGSTTQSLQKRFRQHKSYYRRNIYATSKYVLQYEDAEIHLILNYQCNNVNELRLKEGEYIRNLNCVNTRIEGRTRQEYNIFRKSKYTCSCGRRIQYREKARHIRTKKHRDLSQQDS